MLTKRGRQNARHVLQRMRTFVERYRQASTFNGALFGTYFARKKIQRAVNAALACVPAVMAGRKNVSAT